jgi:anti-anti-sigma regulatory factor
VCHGWRGCAAASRLGAGAECRDMTDHQVLPVAVQAGFVGAFDALLQSSLDNAVAGWCRTSSPAARAAQIDLTGVTVLDADGLSCLNRAHAVLTRAGWTVQLTPPEEIEPRFVFIRAAAANSCNWCRGSSPAGR